MLPTTYVFCFCHVFLSSCSFHIVVALGRRGDFFGSLLNVFLLSGKCKCLKLPLTLENSTNERSTGLHPATITRICMKYQLRMSKDHGTLMREIRLRAGVDLSKCYQCGECTAGCPIVPEMDAGPTKTLRLIQLGMEEELFQLTTPWLCASCETCTTRCPNDIDIARVMDVVRQMARLKGKKLPLKEPRVFQDVFLKSMRTHGTLFEPEMMALYNLKSFHLFHDVGLGPPMLLKGKLPLTPHRSKNRERLQQIFQRAEVQERHEDRISTEETHAGQDSHH